MSYAYSFFAGVVAVLAAPALPPAWVAVPVALVAVLAGLLCRRVRMSGAVCGLCCGLLFAGLHARSTLAHRWPESLADERVIASVVIDSIPAPLDTGWAFDGVVRIEAPAGPPASAVGNGADGLASLAPAAHALANVVARWGDERRVRLVSRDSAFRPHAGEQWRLLLALRPPRGRANPGAQDFERNLFRDGVHALGTVLPSSLTRRVDAGHRPLGALRERISRRIEAQVTDRDAAALICALAVGDTGRVSREQWRVFNATGTTHLVAISGMHVTLFAVIVFALARGVWSACVWAGARWPASGAVAARIGSWPRETFAAALGFIAAMGYATLAGLSVPTQRTLIMLAAWLLARSLARASRPFHPFALALLAVLLLDPFAPLSAGFWLSFAAMGAIILTTSGLFARRPIWREALTVQAVVTLVLIPFSLALFGSVSLIGPPVNLLAIPAMSWVLIPTVLTSLAVLPISSGASHGVLSLAEWLHNCGWPWLAAASDVPFALLHAHPPWWWYGLAFVASALSLMRWPLPMRIAALLVVLPLAVAIDRPLAVGNAEVTVLDVGEGSAVVVRTARHVLVHGTGDSYGTDGRMAESVVAPYLRSVGVRAIDRLVLARHSPAAGQGVVALWAEMPIRQTLVGDMGDDSVTSCVATPGTSASGEAMPEVATPGVATPGVARPGASTPAEWEWDGVTFAFESPAAGHACELTVSAGGARVVIPADVAAVVEGSGARWLVVSGRRAQRSAAKYAQLHPELRGAEELATAEQGAIRFKLDSARGLQGPVSQRAQRRTLWATSP